LGYNNTRSGPRRRLKQKIGRYSYEEYLTVTESFHGYAAPGLVMGGFMVDMALGSMPRGVLFDAICETRNCLPDAIQLLTPCTIGNGWLRILNLGRYALSLYDKKTGEGIRVFVDAGKVRARPEIEAWLFKLKSKDQQDSAKLLNQIAEAGHDLYGVQPIRIQPALLVKMHKQGVATCPHCTEPYPHEHGAICRACQGESPYVEEVPGSFPTDQRSRQ
jgi:formylmethanofuran dehydrogenase subunit E